MKKTLLATIAAFGLGLTSVFAGITTSEKDAKTIVEPENVMLPYFGMGAEYLDRGNGTETEAYSMQLGITMPMSETLAWRLYGEGVAFANGDENQTQLTVNAGLLYKFADFENIYLYLDGGIGAAYADGPDTATKCEWAFLVQGKTGVGFILTDNMALEVGARYTHADFDTYDNVDDWSYGVSLQWNF